MKKLTLVGNLVSAFSLLACFPQCLEGRDFGIMGNTFPIAEESMIKFFSRAIEALPSELLEKRQEEAKRLLVHQAQHPQPVSRLKEAKEYRSFHFDPSFTAKEEIKGSKGTVIVPSGTKVNLLETVSLSTGLLFIDGDNKVHIEWARKQVGNYKWVLIKGAPIALEQKELRPVYFDQRGWLTSYFHIQHVPAKVSQEGTFLLIEEIPAKEGWQKPAINNSQSLQSEINEFIAMALQNAAASAKEGKEKVSAPEEEGAAERKCSTKASVPHESSIVNKTSLFIFISFSVPIESWKDLSCELEKAGGVFVLNGIPNGSFSEFADKVKEIRSKGIDAPIQIDPQSFEKYGIEHVPAFVLDDGNEFDKIYGNIPLSKALQLIAETGRVSGYSKKILNSIDKRDPEYGTK